MCVRERENVVCVRERENVCVCACVSEREREFAWVGRGLRERGRSSMPLCPVHSDYLNYGSARGWVSVITIDQGGISSKGGCEGR